jgi:hypothetical protein
MSKPSQNITEQHTFSNRFNDKQEWTLSVSLSSSLSISLVSHVLSILSHDKLRQSRDGLLWIGCWLHILWFRSQLLWFTFWFSLYEVFFYPPRFLFWSFRGPLSLSYWLFLWISLCFAFQYFFLHFVKSMFLAAWPVDPHRRVVSCCVVQAFPPKKLFIHKNQYLS